MKNEKLGDRRETRDGGREPRRSALGSAGVCYPKDPTNRIPQGSGYELLQEAWPNEFFFGLCWCLLPRRLGGSKK